MLMVFWIGFFSVMDFCLFFIFWLSKVWNLIVLGLSLNFWMIGGLGKLIIRMLQLLERNWDLPKDVLSSFSRIESSLECI